MERTHFPGYGRCTVCHNIISEKDFHNHTLNCRPKSSKETKLCQLCNKHIHLKEFEEHMKISHQQQTLPSNSNLPLQKKCPFCQKLVEDVSSHCQECDKNNDGYQTPPETDNNIPNSDKIQTKLCTFCSQQINQSDFKNHQQSCPNNHNTQNLKTNSTEVQKLTTHKKKPTKLCALCSEQIDESEYEDHLESCSKEENLSKKEEIISCNTCNEQFNQSEYDNHIESCSNRLKSSSRKSSKNTDLINDTKSPSYSSEIEKSSSKSSIVSKNKQTKLCVLCSKQFHSSEYENHLNICSNNEQSTDNNSTNPSQILSKKVQRKKQCALCFHSFDEEEYGQHVQSCENNHNTNPTEVVKSFTHKKKPTEVCGLCSKEIDQSEYDNHLESCSNNEEVPRHRSTIINGNSKSRNSRKISLIKTEEKKECVLCSQLFNEEEYAEHVGICLSEQLNKNSSDKKSKQKISRKECIVCFQSIDELEFINHVTNCTFETSPSQLSSQNHFHRDNQSTSNHKTKDKSTKTKEDCFICFKSIDLSHYEDHVLSCIAQTDNQTSNSTTNKNINCLTCKRSINRENDFYQEIPCHSRHNHCLSCLKHSLEEFVRNSEIPVCHKILCDYQLSRHDISLIPLERRLSDRLLKLVKGQQRPLCSKCHFYININENEDFDEHFESCGDLIPCEYCQYPYSFKQLENHSKQCRHDQTSQNEKLINFILPRTKYPFTKEQIRIYIQQQYLNHRNQLDPSSIIETLAVFGPIFPYEIPTRECGVCMESRPYDDIYVFDCDDSHKLCYSCYYQSCKAKMNSGEMLTCALCTHPLRDGELNQLRIPIDELKQIRDYQMKKSFDIYSSRTRGIIKCPNQNCRWVAEADDPNERFRVQCPQCNSEFCSLCNQQYHYRTTCQQLPQITQRWFFWCQTERTRYLTMRAQQDAEYANQLEDYNRQSNENNTRNQELRRRYDELMNDEQYKAQNCRLCPSCKRVVQRLEGCDAMVCGQDAHGGNLQSGCQAKFNWAQAQPYAPTATQQPQQTILDLPKPDNPIVHHEGIRCDHCQNDVDGIRFDCVHCPALTFCEKCEQEATLTHSRENQVFEQQQHVFKLIMIPEE